MSIANYALTEMLRVDGELTLSRGLHTQDQRPVLAVVPSVQPSQQSLKRLEREYALQTQLDSTFAVRPLALLRNDGQTMLVLEHSEGATLDSLISRAWTIKAFLRIAIGVATALSHAHERGLIHKDIKPANLIVDPKTAKVRLTGFGIATRLPREHQPPDPPEIIQGTWAYMAPEQTGRMNRSTDSRADLYALGVTLYQVLTGALPFNASEPLDWIHCHVARFPTPPVERDKRIPGQLSAIIMKLLAKAPEERYQTAAGLAADLSRCLSDWETSGTIAPFSLAQHDIPRRLLIPEKLYGRELESRTLLEAFERVVAHGTPELVLVSGYSGVGKSSLVNELNQLIVLPRGLFASGKFDQYKRGIPYATLAQAFQTLIRQVLVKPEAELTKFREAIQEAVGPNGQLIIDLIPELQFVIGKQEPVIELSPREAQNRFQAVFSRFLSVFARKQHPLVLFLDDLQWLDPATLAFLEHVLRSSEVRHLLLIGAYRDNEVTPSHPLMLTLDSIRHSHSIVHHIQLSALSVTDVEQLLCDALHCKPPTAEPLARLLHKKTAGNPFFLIQFLTTLHEERLLTFDTQRGEWAWDTDRIQAKGFTENVVDLMVEKLSRLPSPTLDVLKSLACLGNSAPADRLSRIAPKTNAPTQPDLWQAEHAGLLVKTRNIYAFAHDRIQEAAYSLIPEQERPATHLRIARLLSSGASESEIEERIFELCNHFNRAIDLVSDESEVEFVYRLNVRAANKARAAIAYASARVYLRQALLLLPADAWRTRYEEKLRLSLELAECEYLIGNSEVAEASFDSSLGEARTRLDRAKVYRLRAKLYQITGRHQHAWDAGLAGLELFGVTFPSSEEELATAVSAEVQKIQQNLRGRSASELLNAEEATDPEARAIIGLIAELHAAAFVIKSKFFPLLNFTGLNFSLRYGNTKASCVVYAFYATLRASLFGDVALAFEYSELSLRLNDKFNDARLKGMLLVIHGASVNFWRRHFQDSFQILERAFVVSLNVGDFVYASYNASLALWHCFETGEDLDHVLDLSEKYAGFLKQTHNIIVHLAVRQQQQFFACLQGLTFGPTSLSNQEFDELEALATFTKAGYGPGIARHYILKQFAAVVYQSYEEALEYGAHAESTVAEVRHLAVSSIQPFLQALALAALYPTAPPSQQGEFAEKLQANLSKLKAWSDNCPENFLPRYTLVAAELARIEHRGLDALSLYEKAIASARDNGFVHLQALSSELAARFCFESGLQTPAQAYLCDARAAYLRWGALGKVKQLDRQYPNLEAPLPTSRTSALGASVEQLDLSNAIKAAQAVSSEIVIGSLVQKLLGIVTEHAGAERGLLLLPEAESFAIVAEATTGASGVGVELLHEKETHSRLPDSILRYAVRTHESVILDDGSQTGLFTEDPYIRRSRARSILCLPLMKQAELVGVLYLENSLTSGAFTPHRVAMLNVLASQAAISLENARLYSELADERARLHAIIQQVPAGLIIAEAPTGRLLVANDQVEPILKSPIHWSRSVDQYGNYVGFHPDGRQYEPHEWPLSRSIQTGETVRGEEVQLLHGDRSRGWVSLSSTPIRDAEGRITAGVVILQDISERKLKEQELRLSEERFSRAFHNNPTPMSIVRERDGSILDVNENFLRLLMLSRERIVGRPMGELGAEYPALLAKLRQFRQLGQSLHNDELVIFAASGDRRKVLVSNETIQLEGELCFLVALVDMTKHELVEEQLRQSQKLEAIGSLAGGIAHDFNNLLTLINGNSELALMRLDESHAAYELIKSVISSGERAADLTRKLLAFSRRQVVNPKVCDLNAIVADVEGLLRRLIEEDVELVTALAPDLGSILADRGQLEQILLNLATNARDAMPGGGQLTIETANVNLDVSFEALFEITPGPHVMLSCRDTGVGMPPEVKSKIFDPFFTTKAAGKGTGLGLAVVYGIVKQAGGNISLISELGAGTTICIYFPRTNQVPEPPASPRDPETLDALRGSETVLLAEDEDELRNFIARTLKSQGYQVLTAQNGREALQLVANNQAQIDILVTDIVMPEVGGRELAVQLRKSQRTVPIVFISGYTNDPESFRENPPNLEYFLAKPFGSVDLAKKLRQALQDSLAARTTPPG